MSSRGIQEKNTVIFNETFTFCRDELQSQPKVEIVQMTPQAITKVKKTLTKYPRPGKIQITKENCVSTLHRIISDYSVGKLAILNVASFTTPGGGVTRGIDTQEEFLCRISNLYPALVQARKNGFYPLHNGLIIKNVTFFRDEDYNFLRKKDWIVTDVIIISVPWLLKGQRILSTRSDEISDQFSHLLETCLGYDCLILSAFYGRGIYPRLPVEISKVFRDLLINQDYLSYFQEVIFANPQNYEAFYLTFKSDLKSLEKKEERVNKNTITTTLENLYLTSNLSFSDFSQQVIESLQYIKQQNNSSENSEEKSSEDFSSDV